MGGCDVPLCNGISITQWKVLAFGMRDQVLNPGSVPYFLTFTRFLVSLSFLICETGLLYGQLYRSMLNVKRELYKAFSLMPASELIRVETQ